jgi:hypothetical protein
LSPGLKKQVKMMEEGLESFKASPPETWYSEKRREDNNSKDLATKGKIIVEIHKRCM